MTAASVAMAVPAAAQDDPLPRPDASAACPDRPVFDDAPPDRDAPLVLPPDWAEFADMSVHWLAVRTQLGSVHCVETTWAMEAANFERLGDRFLGYDWNGYEAGGYMLIDTAGVGSSMDTGAKPVFSPSGSHIAAAQFSDAGWGGFEGFGVWYVFIGGVSPQHVDTHMPPLADWRIDSWEGDDCVHLSGISYDIIVDWQRRAQYPREHYVAQGRHGWKLTAGKKCLAD